MRFILPILIFFQLNGIAQSLSVKNFRHLYDPSHELNFNWLLTKTNSKIEVNWSFTTKSSNTSDELYLLEWEKRNSYSQRQGKTIRTDSVLLSPGTKKAGVLTVEPTDEPWLLVASITKVTSSENWLYTQLIEKKYPVIGNLKDANKRIYNSFIKSGKSYTIEGKSNNEKFFVYYYNQAFPSAYPPFSKNTAGADPVMLHDSTFTLTNNDNITFNKDGLYLIQSDTTSAEGFSFRVASGSFPKYTRIEDLIPPLIYVCTRDEYTALQNSNGDKVKFDKTILTITKDKDRAKRFVRSYYNRIELANTYFNSFKEGWKTDMGMVYIIFGLPDEVRVSDHSEIWYYKNSRSKFVFVKKGSVYDPNYYVLVRDQKYTQLWYNSIDLWRKSRF